MNDGAIQRLLNAAHGRPFLTEDMIWSAQAERNAIVAERDREQTRADLAEQALAEVRAQRSAVIEHLLADAMDHLVSWPADRRWSQGVEYAAARVRAGVPLPRVHHVAS